MNDTRHKHPVRIRNRFQLSLLDEADKQRVHRASMTILETVGTIVTLPEALELLAAAGADTRDPQRVKLPASLVEDLLGQAPGEITVFDRNGEEAMALGGGNSYFGTGPTIQFVRDIDTGERRPTDREDIAKAALIADHLPNIDFVMTMGMSGGIDPASRGIDPAVTDRYDFAAMLTHTTKPLLFSTWGVDGLADIHAMAVALRGSADEARQRPFMIHFAEPVSPLKNDPEALEKVLFCAGHHIPLIYLGVPLMGATGPVTAAGALALSNAEFLAGLAVAQLKRPGAPMFYGGGGMPLDMRTSITPYGSPEYSLGKVAAREMARFYGLPDFNTGGCTDSKLLDQQASMEAYFSLFQAALAGSSLVHDVGYMETGLTACWELIVLGDELIDQIRHFLRGFVIDDETLALDTIAAVGPGGHFLMEEHTQRHYRDIWYPGVIDRRSFEDWTADGSRTLAERLNARVKDILAHHELPPLPADVQRRIEAIMARAAGR